jgi:hypothetical protein
MRARDRRHRRGVLALGAAAFALLLAAATAAQTPVPVVPKPLRGQISAERQGTHDAANIRTVFHNFGMVGDYPSDPATADLSIFHSVEVPKGTGMNYSDGITPFVLAKVRLSNGQDAYIMETGFRERQAESPYTERIMRFEPRPGYFEADPNLNVGRSIAISSDPRTWPSTWPDRANDPSDPGWGGSWNGYFGKRAAADQESYGVMDDDFYDGWKPYWYPDNRDTTRAGLGLEDRRSRLPVVESPSRERHLLALRHHERGHHGLRRQRRVRAVHGLGRGRLVAVVRRHLRIRRRQRVLRQVQRAEPRLHLGPVRSRP